MEPKRWLIRGLHRGTLAAMAFALAGWGGPEALAAQQPSRCARDFLGLLPLAVTAASPPAPHAPVSVDVEAMRAVAVLFCGEHLSDEVVLQAVGAGVENVALRDFGEGAHVRVEGMVNLGSAVEVVVRYSSIRRASGDVGARYDFTIYRLTFQKTTNGWRLRESKPLVVT